MRSGSMRSDSMRSGIVEYQYPEGNEEWFYEEWC